MNSKYKILFDHQIFTLQEYGGISRCFVELYKNLPKSCQATIAVHESDNVYIREFDGVKPVGYKYNHFITNKHFFGKGHLHLWLDKLKRHKYYPNYNKNYSIELLKSGQYDVFHPTYYDDYFLPYLNGKPFVLTIHDMIPELYPQYFDKDDIQIIMKRKLAPLANAIVVVSEHTKKDVIRILGVPEEKIHVVYHGCSFPVGDRDALYSFPYVLYVGSRGSYKNFLPFVKAIAPVLSLHKDLQVICTGGAFNQNELDMMSKYDVQDRFHHHWVQTDMDLYSLYYHARCFVFPSEYEGFGIPILEAYRSECPVMLNNASCFPEIAGDAAIYFNMSSEESNFSERLEQLLLMTLEERKALISKQNARLSKYSWEESAKQMAVIYQSLCY